jgi:hypothetical protein
MTSATQVYCPEVWEGPLLMTLPPLMSQGQLLWLEFTEPDRGKVVGAFEVVEVIHVYTSHRGYNARLIVKPASDQSSPTKRGAK